MYSSKIYTDKEYYFIVNLMSRTGKTGETWDLLKSYLDENNISYQAIITQGRGHATELAALISDMAADKLIKLIIVGGDGTINEVVNGLKNHDNLRIGLIPVGSGNDLGRGLSVTAEPLEQLKFLLSCSSYKAMDLGKAFAGEEKPRYFTISAGIGVDAAVCKMVNTSGLKNFLNKIGLGSLTYGILTIKALFTIPIPDGYVLFDGIRVDTNRIIFGAAMNHCCEGGGVPMAPHADAFDGKLTLCAFNDLSRFGCLIRFPLLLASKHEKLKQVTMENASRIEIFLNKPAIVHADGEYLGEVDHIIFEIAEEKMNFIM